MINQKAGRRHGRLLALPTVMDTTLLTSGFMVVPQNTPATYPDGGPSPEPTHHRSWSKVDVATAPASYGALFGDEDDTEEEGAED